ncbi:hypothetical protein E1281_25285 [Actinomadura sp. KC345]|uniref:hypothetical protein n=1 Tax=Actinomadura sp. KC345 TaxID=2530371 RepID=UPI00104706CC|nr:hypothetical protein [Actinomadura sp. KC345]TDC48060.1 hypothetical protein E1281_25285 [Actinomadura sp. KC345]
MTTQTRPSGGWEPSPCTEAARAALEALGNAPERAVLLFALNGTIPDAAEARARPGIDRRYPGILARLAERTGATGLLTGHSVSQVGDLGLAVGRLHILGQLGCEWSHLDGHVELVEIPAGLDEFRLSLPPWLKASGMDRIVRIEDVRSHFMTLRYREPLGRKQVERLLGSLGPRVEKYGLAVLPGPQSVEIGPRTDERRAVLRFVRELPFTPSVVVHTGASEGDWLAFRALELLRDRSVELPRFGVPTLKVCASTDPWLQAKADLIVPEPPDTIRWFQWLCEITGSEGTATAP